MWCTETEIVSSLPIKWNIVVWSPHAETKYCKCTYFLWDPLFILLWLTLGPLIIFLCPLTLCFELFCNPSATVWSTGLFSEAPCVQAANCLRRRDGGQQGGGGARCIPPLLWSNLTYSENVHILLDCLRYYNQPRSNRLCWLKRCKLKEGNRPV